MNTRGEGEIRLALVGGAKAFHGRAFAAIINGYDAERMSTPGWWVPQHRLEGARITKVWDPDNDAAEQLARVTGIDTVVPILETCAEDVDGVIIPDDLSMQHQKRARFFLERHLPAFVDKPLSADVTEAQDIVQIAQAHGAPLMTGSALRYAREVEEMRAELDALGRLRTAWAIGPGELIFYGIHALELLHTVLGPGIRSVQNLGTEGQEIVHVEFESGMHATMAICQEMAYVFGLSLYGAKGWRTIQVKDSSYYYWNLLQHFVQMVRTGEPPIPPDYAVEIIRALNLAKLSRQQQGRVANM